MQAREQAFRKKLGRGLRAARKARGLSQRQVAERAGIAEKYLSRVELAMVTPSVLIAHRIVRALGVSLDSLLGDEVDERLVGVMTLLSGLEPREAQRAVRLVETFVAGARANQLPRAAAK